MSVPSFLTDSWTDVEKFFGLNGQTTADTTGMTPAQAKIATSSATMKNLGLLGSLFGAANSAIGSYFAAQTQQYQLRSQASTLQFQSGMDAINAHGAEMSAQSILEAGKTQVEQYTMRAGQEAAATEAATAGRGIDLASGSAIAERASADVVKQIDVNTISANATRAAWAQRTQATNDRNASLLTGVSAGNMRASADSISPGAAATTSLLNSATGIASQWDWRRKLQMATASGYGGGMSFVPMGAGQ